MKAANVVCRILLSALLVWGMFFELPMASAEAAATSVSIEFLGDEAKIPGFAQCEITITPGAEGAKKGYYLLYYTDGAKVLPNYDEVTAIKITGSVAKGEISDGIMLPPEAKGFAVFESDTYFLQETPKISDAIATAPIPAEKQRSDLGEVQFSFGALSDTHMNYQKYDRGAYEKLQASLNFFAQKEMDIVIITGDITGDRGEDPDLEAQYEKHNEILNNSDFSSDRVYEAIGNHGNTPADLPLFHRYLGGKDQVHPYKESPYYHVLFEGVDGAKDNLFIFMAQEIKAAGDSAAYDNFSKKQIDWLEKLLDHYSETETNVFIIIHSPFRQFGAGDIKNGTYSNCITFEPEYQQTMRLQMLLESHKDAIVMSGHSHVSFYENANYSDLENQFARTVHIGSNCQPCAYGESASMIRNYDGRRYVDAQYGSEGYTVEVYSDFIVYTGYNFSTGKKIPDACLLIPAKAKTAEDWGEEAESPSDEPGGSADAPSNEADQSPLPPKNPFDSSANQTTDVESSAKPSAPPSTQVEGETNPSQSPSANGEEDSGDSSSPNEQMPENQILLDFEESPKNATWVWLLIILGLLVVAVIVPIVVVLLYKKK